MAAELLIRPGSNDHQVVADLLAPGAAAHLLAEGRPLISRLVVDAHLASQRRLLAQAAAGAGISYLIDPLTHLLQGEVRVEDRWARLPYAVARAVAAEELESSGARDELVAAVVDFQVEAGATAVIPPYAYAMAPEDPWFTISLDMITRTAAYMRRSGIKLQIVPLLCAQLQSFGIDKAWPAGIDRFTAAALAVEPVAVALCLSPVGAGSDSYHKVLRLFTTTEHVIRAGVPVFAWRQGIYGPALVAAGARGYETGIGTSEQCNMASSTKSRRPRIAGKKQGGGAAPGVFLEPLGRSVTTPIASALLGDLRMRPKVMCDDERCCPLGPTSTLDQHREHAVRARARTLAALDAMPQRAWKLHRVARDARASATLIGQANKTLRSLGMKATLRDSGATSLARVADYLSEIVKADAQ
jgi:hypothetical protein